ncbi:unnamed protein product, partial [Nesidiocoris tenuis]
IAFLTTRKMGTNSIDFSIPRMNTRFLPGEEAAFPNFDFQRIGTSKTEVSRPRNDFWWPVKRSLESSYLHFVKTATMTPYVTTLNFQDISNMHVQELRMPAEPTFDPITRRVRFERKSRRQFKGKSETGSEKRTEMENDEFCAQQNQWFMWAIRT